MKNILHKFVWNLKSWRTVDIFCALYLIILSVLILIFPERISYWYLLVIANALGTVMLGLFRRLSERWRSGFLGFVMCAFPLLIFLWIYKEIEFLMHILHSGWFDAALIKMEYWIFSVHLNVWSQHFISTFVTEWMMFAYFIYVPLIPVISAILFFKVGEKSADRFLTALTMAYGTCFFISLLIPMQGPRFAFSGMFSVDLGGSIFRWLTTLMEHYGQNSFGCFPSPHCAAGTVMLLFLRKYHKITFYFMLPVVITFYISTVYGRYHYISDTVAGIFIGMAIVSVEPGVERLAKRLRNGIESENEICP